MSCHVPPHDCFMCGEPCTCKEGTGDKWNCQHGCNTSASDHTEEQPPQEPDVIATAESDAMSELRRLWNLPKGDE